MLFLEKIYSNTSPHKVRLVHGRLSQVVFGDLTAGLSLRTSARWSDMSDQRGSNIMEIIAEAAEDRSTIVSAFTNQVWKGSELVTISVQVGHIALHTTLGEIIYWSKELLKWPLPPDNSVPLRAPVNPVRGNWCEIQTSWLRIPELLPVDVTVNYDSMLDRKALRPIKYDATINLQTRRMVTMLDIERWFL